MISTMDYAIPIDIDVFLDNGRVAYGTHVEFTIEGPLSSLAAWAYSEGSLVDVEVDGAVIRGYILEFRSESTGSRTFIRMSVESIRAVKCVKLGKIQRSDIETVTVRQPRIAG